MSTPPSGWQEPKKDWKAGDVVSSADFRRIEENIDAIELGPRGLDPAQAPTGNVGSLRQILDWLANRIKAITGAANWYDAPVRTIAQLHSEKVGRGATNADVEQVKAVILRVDTRQVVIAYDAQGRPFTIQEKDGANVVKTSTITYGPDGKPSQIQETAGGVTVTSTLQYDADGKLVSVSKAVS